MRFSFYSNLCVAGLLAMEHFTPAQAIQMADNQDAFVVNANEFQSLAEVDTESFNADADIMMINA